MSHERKPTTLQRIRRGFYCFLLSSFVWAQLIMIVFGLSFSFVENPIQALSPYKMEFAAPVAAVSSIFATILGGTLSPVLCAYSSSRMRWMLFFYSLAGAVLSVLLACSLGVSATMWLQQNATWKSSDFVPYVVPPVTLMAGTLGGFFGAMVMNRRLKKKKRVTVTLFGANGLGAISKRSVSQITASVTPSAVLVWFARPVKNL